MNNRLLDVLKIRPFFFLFLSEVFAQIAMNMANFMLLIVAFDIANSNTAVSGIVLSFTVPAIVFGLVAGVYVDRWNKKAVLFGTNLLRAGLLVLLAFLHTDLLTIYILSFVIALVTQFFIPAETPMIPHLVPQKSLLPANALFSMGIYGSIFVAYALSGPFLLIFGHKNAFFVLSILFLVSAILVTLIKVPKAKEKPNEDMEDITLKDEVKLLFALMKKTTALSHSLFLLTLSQLIILLVAVIGPGYARHILHIHIDEFPLLFVTPLTLGMITGAIILGTYFHNKSRDKMATWGVFLTGVSVLLFPYGSRVASRSFVHAVNTYLPHVLKINILHIMVVLAFIMGFATAMIFVPSNTVLQEKTSDSERGKIYGALNSMVGLFSLIPIIIVGSFADTFGVGSVLTALGTAILSIWLLRVIFKR